MTITPRGVRHLAAMAGWVVLLVPLVTVLLSVAFSPDSNWTVRTALLGVCVLSYVSPPAALLIAVSMTGLGIVVAHVLGVSYLRASELLTVAALAGCCARAVPGPTAYRRALRTWTSVPVVLFGIAAVASTVVWLRVQEAQVASGSAFIRSLVEFVTRHYFTRAGDFPVVVSTMALIEGLALYVAIGATCQVDRTFFARALRMLTVGGAAVALLSVVRLGEILLRNPGAIEQLRTTTSGLRISPQIPDYIAAGSYFALCWVISLGCAIGSTRRRLLWLGAGIPILIGLYLTGSRSVVAAALVGIVALVLLLVRQRHTAARRVVAAAVAAAIVMIAGYSWWTGRDVAGITAGQSLQVRAELFRTGVRVIETRPAFGVGIDRFHVLAESLASPELNALFPTRKHAHNDFLRFAAELGLVGLGLFVWILVQAARRTWHALETARDPRIAGVAGGLIAFATTGIVSNPLMVREASFAFWIALGLAAAHAPEVQLRDDAAEPRRSAAAGESTKRRSLVHAALAVLLGAVLVCSIPSRISRELADVDLTGLSYGLYEWGTGPDRKRARWSAPRATLFVDGRARLVEIPLSGIEPASGGEQQVEVRIDGRTAARIGVGTGWQTLRLPLPEDPPRMSRRIDLLVSPSWVPAERYRRSQDRRELGVRVGEITVVIPDAAR